MISPRHISTSGYLNSPLSVGASGYLVILHGGTSAAEARIVVTPDELRKLQQQIMREDDEILAIIMVSVEVLK